MKLSIIYQIQLLGVNIIKYQNAITGKITVMITSLFSIKIKQNISSVILRCSLQIQLHVLAVRWMVALPSSVEIRVTNTGYLNIITHVIFILENRLATISNTTGSNHLVFFRFLVVFA